MVSFLSFGLSTKQYLVFVAFPTEDKHTVIGLPACFG